MSNFHARRVLFFVEGRPTPTLYRAMPQGAETETEAIRRFVQRVLGFTHVELDRVCQDFYIATCTRRPWRGARGTSEKLWVARIGN